jgi:cell fate (sporulation/competence/biofilm development) regulator YlbF (YheA/YmcA/DUF963 family)
MVSNIYLLAGELKDLLDNDERLIRLNKLENELNNNEEVMALSYQKDLAVSSYSDALNHFANDSEEIKKYQHELFLKKEALDNHPLVKSYLKAYSEVRDLYFQINEILFNDLSLHQKEKRTLR